MGTFGEYRVMAQPVPRDLPVAPLITRDFAEGWPVPPPVIP
jgi:hypothetical protein